MRPRARPRGMIVTLWIGSVPGISLATRACPASWYAVFRFSSSEMMTLFRSTPIITLSLAESRSFPSTLGLSCRAAIRAASFTRFARSAPEKPECRGPRFRDRRPRREGSSACGP